MVQNYLGSVRRVVHRFNNLFERIGNGGGQRTQSQPRESPNGDEVVGPMGESVVGQLQELSKRFREFTLQWSRTVGKQQSPLIDRIPPRGVELWRDFWDTVRKQIRRINNEFLQVTRDMGRMLTGRRPSNPDGTVVIVRPRENENGDLPEPTDQTLGSLLYSAVTTSSSQQAIEREFHEFYEKLTAQLKLEQQKMDAIGKATGHEQQQVTADDKQANNLIEEFDDEQTRLALTQNPGLRQQINQDINVFSSIFDIIRTFLTRLRGSAEDIRNILERPGAMRDNNSVTPGPAVKPTVDQLLKDTVDSQRNINGQARPTGR